jgi:hypothetical protein
MTRLTHRGSWDELVGSNFQTSALVWKPCRGRQAARAAWDSPMAERHMGAVLIEVGQTILYKHKINST